MPRTKLGTTTKIAILTVAAVAALTAPAAAVLPPETPAQAGAAAARVTGDAQIALTFSPDTDIRAFAIDAQAVPYSRPMKGAPHGLPTDARGTVKVSHHSPEGGWTVTFEAAVDCLATSPGNATLTAVVTRADEVVKDQVGKRIGVSVQDGGPDGRDRLGFSWAVVNGTQSGNNGTWKESEVGTCMGPAAFAPVTKGGYTVEHADLLAPPATR